MRCRMWPDGRAVALLVGDLLVLAAFAVLGRRTPKEAAGPAAAGAVAGPAAPFVAGWVAGALASGVFRRGPMLRLTSMLARTLGAWIVAFPLAVVLRALLLGRPSPWTFYAVAVVVPLLMLLAWRSAFVVGARWSGGSAGARRDGDPTAESHALGAFEER